MPRTKKKAPDVRHRIFQAAEGIFAEKDYASTSIREIAEVAGVTVPMIYYYFQNKEGLYRTLLEEGISDLERLLKSRRKRGSGARERLISTIGAFFQFCRQDTGLVRLINRRMACADRTAPPMDYWRGFQVGFDTVKGIVLAGQREGEFVPCDADEAAMVIIGAIVEHARMYLREGKISRLTRGLAERIVDIVLKGIRMPERMSAS